MRSKEDAQDYRYFPDPDLLPLVVTEKMVDDVRKTMPELREKKLERFKKDYALSAYDALALTSHRAMATISRRRTRLWDDPKLSANWVMGEVAAYLNRYEKFFDQPPVTTGQLGKLLIPH